MSRRSYAVTLHIHIPRLRSCRDGSPALDVDRVGQMHHMGYPGFGQREGWEHGSTVPPGGNMRKVLQGSDPGQRMQVAAAAKWRVQYAAVVATAAAAVAETELGRGG